MSLPNQNPLPPFTPSTAALPWTPPNPHTTNRADYTASIIAKPLPPNATPTYTNLVTALAALYNLLAHHPKMAPNLTQTFMTPANVKSKIYFMWDFTGRTLQMLEAVDALAVVRSTDSEGGMGLDPQLKQLWEEITGRAQFGTVLILDTSGKIEMMCGGDTTDFGDEVRAAAEKVRDVAF